MRVRFVMTCAASFYLFAFVHGVLAAQSRSTCDVPFGLSDEISKKYPGTSLVNLKDLNSYDRKLFEKDHGRRCPGLVKVNFYGDGKPTWALVLLHTEPEGRKAELIVGRQDDKTWDVRLLDTRGPAPAPGVWG